MTSGNTADPKELRMINLTAVILQRLPKRKVSNNYRKALQAHNE